MREKTTAGGVCPHCGFDASSYQVHPYQLPPFTVLHGRYLLGKVLGAGGFGITYMAMDLLLERPVAIKEYFIQNGCMMRDSSHTPTISVIPGSEVASKMYEVNRDKFEQEARLLA